jgi:hypothetical protein
LSKVEKPKRIEKLREVEKKHHPQIREEQRKVHSPQRAEAPWRQPNVVHQRSQRLSRIAAVGLVEAKRPAVVPWRRPTKVAD